MTDDQQAEQDLCSKEAPARPINSARAIRISHSEARPRDVTDRRNPKTALSSQKPPPHNKVETAP